MEGSGGRSHQRGRPRTRQAGKGRSSDWRGMLIERWVYMEGGTACVWFEDAGLKDCILAVGVIFSSLL